MNVFLTGATGFVGSHIAEALLEAGHEVRASVRASSDLRWVEALPLERVTLDLRDPLEGSFEGFDAVIHCAGLTRARTEEQFLAVNAEGSERIAERAVADGVRRLVLISSLAARGPDGAGGPVSPYGRSKHEGERRLLALSDAIELSILRPGGVYGPRDSDLLPLFRMAAKGFVVTPKSRARLQPVYVTDVVSATMAALEGPPVADPLPVAGEDTHPWDEVARLLMAAVAKDGRRLTVPPGVFWFAGLLSELGSAVTGTAPAMDRRRARDMSHFSWTCDVAPTTRALDWRPAVDLGEGLAKTAAWYREQGWL